MFSTAYETVSGYVNDWIIEKTTVNLDIKTSVYAEKPIEVIKLHGQSRINWKVNLYFGSKRVARGIYISPETVVHAFGLQMS